MEIRRATLPFTPDDDGSPTCYYKVNTDGRAGFLIIWPKGTRLWIQTHTLGYEPIDNPAPLTWHIEPQAEMRVA